MEKTILSLFDVNISLDLLLDALKLDKDDDAAHEVSILYEEALKVAKPVAVYMPLTPVFVDNAIILNRVTIKEPFVFDKLSGSGPVIAYVVSCGVELDVWSKTVTGFFEQFVAEALMQLYLKLMTEELSAEIKRKFFDENKFASTISPGSQPGWLITGQSSLFDILGSVKEDIGVELKDNLLMSPAISFSGIFFQTSDEYHNCHQCTRSSCNAVYGS